MRNELLGIAGAEVTVFSAGSEALTRIGRNPWDPTGPNLYNPTLASIAILRNPNGVNSNSFRSSYNIYGPYKSL